MRRGDYLIARAETEPFHLDGKFLDVLSPELTIQDGIDLNPGEDGLYKDVTARIADDAPPCVLHTTYRLVSQDAAASPLRFTAKGPKDTDLVARIHTGGRKCKIKATGADGATVSLKTTEAGNTVLIQCPNDVRGVTITVAQ